MTTTTEMTIIEALQKELEAEAITTRKMLACVPDDKFDWKPHTKSMTLRTLATHVAELPTWIGMALNTDELDFAANPYQPVKINNTEELLAYFEKSLEDGREQLKNANEERFGEEWILRQGDMILSKSSKYEVIRMTMSQIIHHRAQLGVYLRLLDVPIPGSYGPSADEMGM
ncbi:MAG TPA: DinB family protein [Patescibacteria group bacterium]|nr:DinB family protein [Patescibacteria group bacterium]